MTLAEFRELKVGQTINIRTVTTPPFLSEYENSDVPRMIPLLLGGGVLFLALSVGLLPGMVKQSLSLRRATENGVAESAEIIPAPGEVTGERKHCVYWRSAGGVEGHSLRLYRKERPQPGEVLPVAVDSLTGKSYWVKEL